MLFFYKMIMPSLLLAGEGIIIICRYLKTGYHHLGGYSDAFISC